MKDAHADPGSEDLSCTGRSAAAAAIGVSLSTLDRLRLNGELPTIRIGRRVLIRTADLRAFIEGRRTLARQSGP